MREYKFRAWDNENNQMLDVQELNFEDCFYGGEMQIKTTMYNDYFDCREMPLMQYTGLHDKNGKEVYEGDIVLIDAYKYEGPEFSREYLVKYNELLGMWTLIDLENYDKEEFITFEDLNGWYRLDIELLGNEYENKELLNETNR